jgi:hypothetical protein
MNKAWICDRINAPSATRYKVTITTGPNPANVYGYFREASDAIAFAQHNGVENYNIVYTTRS